MIAGVPVSDLQRYAPVILPYLENFAERSDRRVTVPGLIRDLYERERQCWLGVIDGKPRCCALTRLVTDPGGDAVYIDHCAGEGRGEWVDDLLDTITAWARESGATRVFSSMRPGWTKWAKGRGFRERHREFVMEVSDG